MRRLFLVLACLLLSPVPGAGRGLEPFLARVSRGEIEKAGGSADALLAWDPIEAQKSRARVWIHRQAGVEWDRLRLAVHATDPSASWEGELGDFAQIVVSFSALATIAEMEEVYYCFRPPRCVAHVASEGLEEIGVADFRKLGYTGEGVRAGVIDLGFDRYDRLVGSELPADLKARSYFRSPSGQGDITGGGEDHGTACAELVYDIAPGARLYLANVETPVDLQQAVEWMLSQKVSVVSHSIGWYFGSLDGRGPINDIVDAAARRGLLWINSAGNEARRHSWFEGRDVDGDQILEVDASGDEDFSFPGLSLGSPLTLALLWDRWPTTEAVDLQIDMLDAAGDIVATSETDFQGYPYAFRYLEWTASGSAPFRARIRQRRGSPEGLTIHLFRIGSGTALEEHVRSDRSLLSPADSPEVIAAGATDWRTGDLEPYSSRGSTELAPVKPELCVPVGVSTRTYGSEGFRGTSAAAPQLAGAAALLASAGLEGGLYDLVWSREEIIRILRDAAEPEPAIEVLGWGRLRMPDGAVGAPAARDAIRLMGNPACGQARWSGPCAEAEIFDSSGRRVARSSGSTWDGRDETGRIAPAGLYWIRCGEADAARLIWLGRGAERGAAR